jgi:uncharacterized protein YbjQ (UPF0145 family)
LNKKERLPMRILMSVLALAVVTGCGGAAGRGAESAKGEVEEDEPLPTDPVTIAKAKNVRVLQNESLGCPTEVLGPVDVHRKMESTDKALEGLKLRAAAVGADAVSNVEFEHGEGGEAPTHLAGLAVRCRDIIRGRPYDVVGKLVVHKPMGKEEEAFADLKAQATALHANLILDVKFIHGEGGEGEGTTMTGTAARTKTQ